MTITPEDTQRIWDWWCDLNASTHTTPADMELIDRIEAARG